MSDKLLANRVATALQAGAQCAPIRIRACPARRRALIELLLSHVSLLLRAGVGRRSDDRARGSPDYQSSAGVSRSGDQRSEDRPADCARGSARPRRIGGLYDHTLIGIRVSAARVDAGLLDSPQMTFITIAIHLLRTLP